MAGISRLAQELMQRLATASQQSMLMQMPGLPTRTSDRFLALGVVRGTAWHILAAIDHWNVYVAPPPALVSYCRRWTWHEQGKEPIDEMAVSLAALAEDWWANAPQVPGALDVAGAITHAATATLGTQRGAIGNIVYRGAPNQGLTGVRVARDRDPHWPFMVDVRTSETAIQVRIGTTVVDVTDVNQLARDLLGILQQIRTNEDACERWLAKATALRAAVIEWIARNPPPVEASEWSVWPLSEVKPEETPTVYLMAKAYEAERFVVQAKHAASGVVMEVGTATIPIDSGELQAAIERHARDARDPEMSDYERYR